MTLQDYERQHVAGLVAQAHSQALANAREGVETFTVPTYRLRPGECLICHGDAEPCEVLTDPPLCKACKRFKS